MWSPNLVSGDVCGAPLMQLPLSGPAWVFFVLSLVILSAPLIAERMRLPGVIGLVLAGLAVGPEGVGLLAREGTIAQLGGFGLLYLMFLAGLELELGAIRRDRRPAIVFGLFTFVIPIVSGAGVALLLGFSSTASVLIGSLWASHTLVAYPIVRRAGIVSDRSVVASVGATVITDTLALIVLAIVARSYEAGGGVRFLAALVPGLLLLGAGTLWLLPVVARWFFRGLGQDRTLRFLFVLVGFLGSAVLAEVVGIEGIVGAFLAGLALNALVPNGGALMQRVEFVGSAILIPIFLISVGMLVDLTVAADAETLRLAAAFTAVAVGGKWLAAEVTGRVFGFDRPRIGVMFALSNAQAAATLAATIVGFELGLLSERVVNAVLIVIFVTIVIASWVAGRSVRGVIPSDRPARHVGRMVIVPVANPETAPGIVRLGTWIARSEAGHIAPIHVITAPDAERVKAAGPLVTLVERTALQLGDEADVFVRVDRSVAAGVVNTVLERDGSMVLLGWKGGTSVKARLFGSLVDDIVDRVPCVVAACSLTGRVPQRVVLLLVDDVAEASGNAATTELTRHLSRGAGLPVALVGSSDVTSEPGWVHLTDSGAKLTDLVGVDDLVVVPAAARRSVIGQDLDALVDAGLDIVVVYPATPSRDVGIAEVFAGG